MKKFSTMITGIAIAVCVVMGIAAAKKMITVKGSDTMVILAQQWAELYMNTHSDIAVQVTGGGSGVGITALINGTTDICNSSRPMSSAEREKLKQRYNSLGVETPVAKDGITLYVNEANPVAELTMQQLKSIYTGEITSWNQVGGANEKIILYGRENSSGTYVFFRDNVLGGEDFAVTCQTLPGTAAVVNAVSKDKNSIGYGGAAYAKGVKMVAVKKDAGSKAYQPNAETIRDNVYPISRYLYMYTRSRPTGAIKDFIDWLLSAQGQAVVVKAGYFPVK